MFVIMNLIQFVWYLLELIVTINTINTDIKLSVVDIYGQTQFISINSFFYQDSDVFVVVYDTWKVWTCGSTQSFVILQMKKFSSRAIKSMQLMNLKQLRMADSMLIVITTILLKQVINNNIFYSYTIKKFLYTYQKEIFQQLNFGGKTICKSWSHHYKIRFFNKS